MLKYVQVWGPDTLKDKKPVVIYLNPVFQFIQTVDPMEVRKVWEYTIAEKIKDGTMKEGDPQINAFPLHMPLGSKMAHITDEEERRLAGMTNHEAIITVAELPVFTSKNELLETVTGWFRNVRRDRIIYYAAAADKTSHHGITYCEIGTDAHEALGAKELIMFTSDSVRHALAFTAGMKRGMVCYRPHQPKGELEQDLTLHRGRAVENIKMNKK
ncbi:hypothetical protein RI367_003256 [Sorochytrium milnesiophthora]